MGEIMRPELKRYIIEQKLIGEEIELSDEWDFRICS